MAYRPLQPGDVPPVMPVTPASTYTNGNYTLEDVRTILARTQSAYDAATDELDRVEYNFGLGTNIFDVKEDTNPATVARVNSYINYVRASIAYLGAQLRELHEALQILVEREYRPPPPPTWPPFPPGSSGGSFGSGPSFTQWRQP